MKCVAGCAGPRSDRDRVLACSAMSIAYGREVGMIFVVYIMALAYAACSPMILPFALCYFLSAWVRLRPSEFLGVLECGSDTLVWNLDRMVGSFRAAPTLNWSARERHWTRHACAGDVALYVPVCDGALL